MKQRYLTLQSLLTKLFLLTFIASKTWYHLCDSDVWISALASSICSLEASESQERNDLGTFNGKSYVHTSMPG